MKDEKYTYRNDEYDFPCGIYCDDKPIEVDEATAKLNAQAAEIERLKAKCKDLNDSRSWWVMNSTRKSDHVRRVTAQRDELLEAAAKVSARYDSIAGDSSVDCISDELDAIQAAVEKVIEGSK